MVREVKRRVGKVTLPSHHRPTVEAPGRGGVVAARVIQTPPRSPTWCHEGRRGGSSVYTGMPRYYRNVPRRYRYRTGLFRAGYIPASDRSIPVSQEPVHNLMYNDAGW